MNRCEFVELTVLCMVYDDHKILLQNRVKSDWKGYTFPGGHVEKGESFVEATIREIKEETGLTVKNLQLCGIKQFPIDHGRYIVLLYKTNQYEGHLISSQEGEMKWIDRKSLENIELVEDFMELLQVFDQDDLSEFQYKIENNQWNVYLK